MEDVIARLDHWMREHHPGYDDWEPGATPGQIDALEATLGVALPNGLRHLLAWRQGTPRFIHNQFLTNCDWITIHFEEMGAMAEADEWDDPNHWRKGWFAFTSSGGDCLVIDPHGSFGGQPGQVLDFDHEGGVHKTIVAPDFDSWLRAYVDALEAGVFVVKEGMVEEKDHGLDALISERFPGYPKSVVLPRNTTEYAFDWQRVEDQLFEAAKAALADVEDPNAAQVIALIRIAFFGAGLEIVLDWTPDGSRETIELDVSFDDEWDRFEEQFEESLETEDERFGLEEMPLVLGESVLVGRLTQAFWQMMDRLRPVLPELGFADQVGLMLLSDDQVPLTIDDRAILDAELTPTMLEQHLARLAAE